jgi:hypothetical protein
MIAVAKDPSLTRQTKKRTPSFEELLPLIEKQARVAFRHSPSCEREELIAEVVANCYVAYVRLIERGLGNAIFATPLALFAIKQIHAGRRVGAKLNVRDVSSPYCQRQKRVHLQRLDRRDRTGGWKEVLVEDRHAGPAEVAASRIDFAAWLRTLTSKQRRIAKTLAAGETTQVTARKFRVSAARVSQMRRELHDAWLNFQGELAVA